MLICLFKSHKTSIYDIWCIPSKQTAHCYGDILHDLCSSQYHSSTISIEQLLSRCLIWNQQKKPQKLLSKLILKCFASRHAIGEFGFFCVISWWRWFWSIPYVLIITIDIFYVDEVLSHSYGNSVFHRILGVGVFEACLSLLSSKLIWLLLLIIIVLNSMSNIYFCLHWCLNIRLRFIYFCKFASINSHKLIKLDASRKTWIAFKWILN